MVTIGVKNAAADVSTRPSLPVTATNAKVESVVLTSAKGDRVNATSQDGTTWIPDTQLAFSTAYTLTATARGNDGSSASATCTFTTAAATGRMNGADLYIQPGEVVGVGMPVVVEFIEDVPAAKRADVERRLLIHSTPQVEGTWSWISGAEVHWRPKVYWPTGAKVDVRLAIGGIDMGNGRIGKRDRTVSFTVGPKIVSVVNNATKTMTITKGGVVLKRIPVSLGRKKYPSSTGTFVIMDKKAEMVFDSSTYGLAVDSPDGYRTKVKYAMRLTWGGEFFHAAPWSVADQGHRNVSHGCVNMSTENARWLFELSHRGDVAQVVGTEVKVDKGNGWMDWTIPWDTYKAGSALV
jgi:lipoprotein-anchoring transpeptidase ErfK/SrfK